MSFSVKIMLLTCFSFLTLLFGGSTAAIINKKSYEIQDIYQMKFLIKNYAHQKTNKDGYFASAKFPVEQGGAKSRFQLAVYPNGKKYPRYFSLAVHSVDNNINNIALYTFDVFVLDASFDQNGIAQRIEHNTTERCAVDMCYQEEAMFLKSRIHEFVKSDGSLEVFVEVFRLRKCAGMCTAKYSQPNVVASRCVKDGSLNYCSQSKMFPQFMATKRSPSMRTGWRKAEDLMTEIKEVKQVCIENKGLTGADCAVIKGVATNTQVELTNEIERSKKSDATLQEAVTDTRKQFISFDSNRFKDSCNGVRGGIVVLKKLIARGVSTTETHITEVSTEFAAFKSEYEKVEEKRRNEKPCAGLQGEVTTFKSDIANGHSNSDKQLAKIASEVAVFKEEFTKVKESRPEKPCDGLQTEISTLNNNYDVAVQQTDTVLKEIEDDVVKFRNDINSIEVNNNACDEVPKKITKLEKSVDNGFKTVNDGYVQISKKLANLVKKGNEELMKVMTKVREEATAAEKARTNERNLAAVKEAEQEKEIKDLECDLKLKTLELKNYNKNGCGL